MPKLTPEELEKISKDKKLWKVNFSESRREDEINDRREQIIKLLSHIEALECENRNLSLTVEAESEKWHEAGFDDGWNSALEAAAKTVICGDERMTRNYYAERIRKLKRGSQ